MLEKDKNELDKAENFITIKMHLSTANLNLKVLKTGTRKLAPKRVGPFHITERMAHLAYRLELPASMTVHDVFHVCYLKPYRDDGSTRPPPVPGMLGHEPEFEVQQILDHRYTKRGH